MGLYSDYIDTLTDFNSITQERKKQLTRISELRKRAVITYAADMNNKGKGNDIGISFADLVPFKDQVGNLSGKELDIIIETPGGLAEVVEDMVRYVRGKFDRIGIIIPGTAKSAGTIFSMCGDEILMGSTSSMGPIDAQVIASNGNRFSADAFLEGLENIKEEVDISKRLNPAYIPILQNISPGEIQHCKNAQNFSKDLVTKWLNTYKFKYWINHSSSGKEVTDEEKLNQAVKIADLLCKQSHWKTHGRSIKIEDFHELGLKVTNYESDKELADAIDRYYLLLRLTFDKTSIFKVFETSTSQIYNSIPPNLGGKVNNINLPPQNLDNVIAEFSCPKCGNFERLQLNFKENVKIKAGIMPFPKDNVYICPKCGLRQDLTNMKLQIEAQTRKKVVL